MNQDEDHLNLLSTFHYVVGPLTMLFSCIFLAHVAMGVMMATGSFMPAKDAPPRVFGWLIAVFASAVVLGGWTIGILIIIAGKRLRQRTSRTFCMIIAGIECIVQPFGTILGAFTLAILMRPSVAALFAANGQSPDASQTQ